MTAIDANKYDVMKRQQTEATAALRQPVPSPWIGNNASGRSNYRSLRSHTHEQPQSEMDSLFHCIDGALSDWGAQEKNADFKKTPPEFLKRIRGAFQLLAHPEDPRNADFLNKHHAIADALSSIKNKIRGRVDLNDTRIADVIKYCLTQAKDAFQKNSEFSVDAIVSEALLRIEGVMDKNNGFAANGSAVGEEGKTKEADATAADKASSNLFLLYISAETVREAEKYYGKDREGLIGELATLSLAAKWGANKGELLEIRKEDRKAIAANKSSKHPESASKVHAKVLGIYFPGKNLRDINNGYEAEKANVRNKYSNTAIATKSNGSSGSSHTTAAPPPKIARTVTP